MRARAVTRGAGASAYRQAPLPAARTPWRSAAYCAVDLELSGLDPRRDEIISFAAIPIDHGRVRLGETIEGRVRPTGPLKEASIRLHGLRVADLEDAPELEVAIDPLLGAMAGRVPVVHVAEIERGFLRPALRRLGLRLHAQMIDTSVLGALWLHERDRTPPSRMTLEEIASALGLPSHRMHDALGDALTTAQVFLALVAHLDAIRPETVRSLSTAARRLEVTRLYPQH